MSKTVPDRLMLFTLQFHTCRIWKYFLSTALKQKADMHSVTEVIHFDRIKLSYEQLRKKRKQE